MIDVHTHLMPAAALDRIRDRAQDFGIEINVAESGEENLRFHYGLNVRPFFERMLDVDKRLAEMDEQGVRLAILSAWTDIFGYGMEAAQGARWHAVLNEATAELCGKLPERFAFLASGPLQDPALAARELERCVEELGAVGGVCACNVEDVNLGEVDLDEYWSAAVALDVPVFLHPAHPAPPVRARRFGLAQSAAYTYDTTLAVVSLIANGVMDRFPDLKLVLSHGGGTLPYLAGRLDCVHRRMAARTGDVAEHDPSAYLRRFYFDTIVFDPRVLRFLDEMVGTDRLVIGTDLPFPPAEHDPLALLRRAGFDDAKVETVTRTTPRQLFCRLKIQDG